MLLARQGIDAIIGYEIGAEFPGDLREYNRKYCFPQVPSDASGVTIGIGYDLGMNSKEKIKTDWQGKVNSNALAFFISCAGMRGLVARKMLKPETKFKVDYDKAFEVFSNNTLPRFCKEAKDSFPSIEKLNPLAQAVIVSVVFNRGNGLNDTSVNAQKEQRRKEMRNLVGAIDRVDYNLIASEIESMKRLWDGIPDFAGDQEQKLQGLIDRRINEAKLVRQSISMQFQNKDIIDIKL